MEGVKALVIERIFDAPVERVWQAWTDPAEISKWWGPRGFASPDNTIDLRVGGRYNFSMQATEGELAKQFGDEPMYSGGTYKEIVENKKLVYTDSFTDKNGNLVSPVVYGMPEDFPRELTVTVTFEALPGNKTKMTLSHEGFIPGDMANQAEAGWNQSFDKLAESL